MVILTMPAMAGTILLEGNYHGRNLYVQNPFASEGVGFCTFEVKVNGQVTTDEINSSAFEIDLSFFQLNLGSPIEIYLLSKYPSRRVIDYKPRPELGARGDFIVSKPFTRGRLPRIKTVQLSKPR